MTVAGAGARFSGRSVGPLAFHGAGTAFRRIMDAVPMSEHFQFRDLRELFAKANEEKSGDQLAGLAAGTEQERVAAKHALADLPLKEIVADPLISPDEDDVSRLILETHDQENFSTIASLTVGELRELILSDETTEATLQRLHWAITPEMAAAVAKLMSNKDLVLA